MHGKILEICPIDAFLHGVRILLMGRKKAKARRKKWTDFVKLKRAQWTATASSAVCSCYFAPEDFARRHCFVGLKQQRTLIKDDIGILPIPRFQRNTFEEKELTPGGGLFIMAYTGRFRPKWVPFLSFRYIKGRDLTSIGI